MDDVRVLAKALDDVLPGAELAVQSLGADPGIDLLLLRDTQAGRGLDGDTARRVMDNPLYWIFCWASGQVLARHVLARPELVAGKRVVDFGCGSGVVAIAAALVGAGDVIACDTDPLARTATRHNARLNGLDLHVSDNFDAIEGPVDLVLVADVLYDRANLDWLVRFCVRAPSVLLADSRIRDFHLPPFEKIDEVQSCTLPDLAESAEFNRVAVYSAGAGG